MHRLGANEEDLARAEDLLKATQDAEACDVWPENWEVWQFFLQVQTQWVRAGMDGRRACLNWPSVEVVAKAFGMRGKQWRELVQALMTVEAAVLEADVKMQRGAE